MTQIFNAKTVEDAKELAARTFGVAQEEIIFEVLEEPKKGFLGIGKKGEAKVQATYVPAVVPEQPESTPQTDSFEEEKTEVPASVQDFTEETPVTAIRSENAITAPETESAISDMSENATTAPETESATSDMSKNATTAEKEKSSIQPDEELITGEPSEAALAKIEKAKAYLLSILAAMGVKADLKVNAGSDSAIIEIVTPNSGAVIGKRGETLDSLQYLTFMTANRADKDYYRIILNTANYRERRRKTLEELAAKIAKNVLHSHRSTTLEPMNPYERRVIHSAIAEIDGVSSKSIGEEPYRKVVISSDEKPQRSGKRRNFRDKNDKSDRHGKNQGRRDRSRRNSDTPPTRISMDSMKTSFEKDYKRPKPEDDINAGLYGKIEF
ncbi:MAG: Jag N-terminal domain-containing protein [Oscillospiraceae bacterium]|nr:Jag N-terminal domain-containing protein [Oscillospiraceae bacterium]